MLKTEGYTTETRELSGAHIRINSSREDAVRLALGNVTGRLK
jgi:hypothetical protein